jgi:HpiC1 cyclase
MTRPDNPAISAAGRRSNRKGFLRAAMAAAVVAAAALEADGAPNVVNPSFEADRFGRFPGSAALNGGKIQGWTFTGAVGVNPWWQDPAVRSGPSHTFDDNGIVPDGRQVAVLQNRCVLSQRIDGFEAGKRYRVTFYENARRRSRSPEPPILEVTLAGQTIVSSHRVTPVEGFNSRTLPYHFVESAVFEAPHGGAFELVFKTSLGTGVSVLLDKISVTEVRRKP